VTPLELAERALAAAEGDEAEAVVHSERSGVARFAASEVHQPTLIENTGVRLRVVRDGKVGSAYSNRVDEQSLAELARRAREVADSARPDPTFPGLAPPADAPRVDGYDEETASLGPDGQARLAAAAIDAAGHFGLYGYFTSGVTELAVASTTGLRQEQAMTDAVCLALAAVDGKSGWAVRTASGVGDVDPAAAGEEAAAKAARTGGAQEIEPGPYRAVLEPYAVADLLSWFAYDSFSGLGLIEERSFFSGRLGEKAMDEKISIAEDPLDERGLPKAFDYEGVAKRRVPLIEGGLLRGVVWDRETAAKAEDGVESTGSAPPDAWKFLGPNPFSLSMAGGDAASPEELAELVGDGIYVTRLHYLSIVQSREGILTGMTRDGTFRIRDGKVAEPLVNLRFTVAVPEVLADVPGLTRDPMLVNLNELYDDRYPFAALVPGLATAKFNITGVGSAPGL
jgi:PmbA protein